MNEIYDGVLLLGFGGPEAPDEVMPFLERVTAGRGVPTERLREVEAHYLHFGGRSPINAQTRALRDALEQGLVAAGHPLPVLLAQRFAPPFPEAAAAEAKARGLTRLLTITPSAFSNASSCRAYVDVCDGLSDDTLVVDKVRQYWNHPGVLAAARARVAAAIDAHPTEGLRRVLCTAHSIPTPLARASRYEAQLAAAADDLRVALSLPDVRVVYQSRSGAPGSPWLEPDIVDAVAEAARDGVAQLVVFPIGFTSDHLEVVWDLDHVAADAARDAGLEFVRVPTFGLDQGFVAALVDVLCERLEGRDARPCGAGAPAEADRCAPGCCMPTGQRPRNPDARR